MGYAILQPLSVAAKNIDSYNINVINKDDDMPNGAIITKGALSTDADKTEVYTAVKPTSATLANAYMVYNPEDVIVAAADGTQYKVGDLNPNAYTNVKGVVCNAFKLEVGDKILISADGITGTEADYAVAANGAYTLNFASAAGASGLALKKLAKTYMSVGSKFGSQRIVAYEFEVEQI